MRFFPLVSYTYTTNTFEAKVCKEMTTKDPARRKTFLVFLEGVEERRDSIFGKGLCCLVISFSSVITEEKAERGFCLCNKNQLDS